MKIFIKTYGCQMNERDSEAFAGMLVEAGHTMVDSEEQADVLLFNTCSVREQAERKALREEYIADWRRSTIDVLENTYIDHGDGRVTKLPKKRT